VEPARYLVTGDAERAQEPVKRGARRQRLLVRVVAAKVGIELTVGEPVPHPMAPVQGQPRLPDPGDTGDDPDRKRPCARAGAPGHADAAGGPVALGRPPEAPPASGWQWGGPRRPGRGALRPAPPRGSIVPPTGRRARAPGRLVPERGRLVPQQGLVHGAQL